MSENINILYQRNEEQIDKHLSRLDLNFNCQEISFSLKKSQLSSQNIIKLISILKRFACLQRVNIRIGQNSYTSQYYLKEILSCVHSHSVENLFLKVEKGNCTEYDNFQDLKLGLNHFKQLKNLVLKIDFFDQERLSFFNKNNLWFQEMNQLINLSITLTNMSYHSYIMIDLNKSFTHLQQLESLKIKFKSCKFYEEQGFELIGRQMLQLENLKVFYIKMKNSKYYKEQDKVSQEQYEISEEIYSKLVKDEQFIFGIINSLKYLVHVETLSLKLDYQLTSVTSKLLIKELEKLKQLQILRLKLLTRYKGRNDYKINQLITSLKSLQMLKSLKLREFNTINASELLNTIQSVKEIPTLQKLSIRLQEIEVNSIVGEILITQCQDTLNKLSQFSIKVGEENSTKYCNQPFTLLLINKVNNLKKFAVFSQIDKIDDSRYLVENDEFSNESPNLTSFNVTYSGTEQQIRSSFLFLNSIKLSNIRKLSLITQRHIDIQEDFVEQFLTSIKQMPNLKVLDLGVKFNQSDNKYCFQITQGISTLSSITELNIEIFPFSFNEKNIEIFFESLSSLQSLEKFSLSVSDNNYIQKRGIQVMANTLFSLKELKELNLFFESDCLDSESALCLIEGISKIQQLSILFLNLRWEDMSKSDVVYVGDCLRNLINLEILELQVDTFLSIFLIKLFYDLPFLSLYEDSYSSCIIKRKRKLEQITNENQNTDDMVIENKNNLQNVLFVTEIDLSIFSIPIEEESRYQQFKWVIDNIRIPTSLKLYIPFTHNDTQRMKQKLFQLFTLNEKLYTFQLQMSGFGRDLSTSTMKYYLFKSKRLVTYNFLLY